MKVSCPIYYSLLRIRIRGRSTSYVNCHTDYLGIRQNSVDACSHLRNSSVQHVETWGPWEVGFALLREEALALSKAEWGHTVSPAGRRGWRSDSSSLTRHPEWLLTAFTDSSTSCIILYCPELVNPFSQLISIKCEILYICLFLCYLNKLMSE